MSDQDDELPAPRRTQILWPWDRVARFWRAVRAGRVISEEITPLPPEDGARPPPAGRGGEPA